MVRRSAIWAGILMAVVMPLSSCAGGGLEGAFAPDPQLQQGTGLQSTASLPPDFPQEIPQYPGAALRSVTSESSGTTSGAAQVQTLWATQDATAQVAEFYRQEFQKNGWSLESDSDTRLFAKRDGLEVRLVWSDVALTSTPSPGASPITSPEAAPEGSPSPAISPSPEALTEFTLSYGAPGVASATEDTTTGASTGKTEDAPLTDNWATRPSPSASPSTRPSPVGTPQTFSDINQAPTELRSYIRDLANLGVLKVTQNPGEFKPNQTITRREYARWLVATNNALFNDAPAKQIRLAVGSDRPTFQDVPPSDPDFATIQGLANTGLIPSPLSGSSTTVRFRPNDPLTREDLVLWKVPLDTRQALPQATLEAIQQTWGFQDVAQIDPRAQKAVLADFQNSDLSNIRRAFGFTTLFQPKKPVTRAEAAAVLWHFGTEGDGVSAAEAAN